MKLKRRPALRLHEPVVDYGGLPRSVFWPRPPTRPPTRPLGQAGGMSWRWSQ